MIISNSPRVEEVWIKAYQEEVAIQAADHLPCPQLFHDAFPNGHTRGAILGPTESQTPCPRTDQGRTYHAAIAEIHTRCQRPSETPRRTGTRCLAEFPRKCRDSDTWAPGPEAGWAGRSNATLSAPQIDSISRLGPASGHLRSPCVVSVPCVVEACQTISSCVTIQIKKKHTQGGKSPEPGER